MKIKNAVRFFASVFLLVFVSCGGSSSTTPASSVTVTLVPSNSSANVAIGATVTATFSAAITEPASWATAFTLKKDNTGETLCTVTYSTLVATCVHADLEAGSSYTIKVSGVTDASGTAISEATATFTTVGYTPVGGTVTLQGTLSAASASVSANKGMPSKAAVDVTSYKALALNNDTGEQKEATVAADGTFSVTLVGGSSYMINFLDSNNKYVGTLKTGEVNSDKVSMGLVTGGDGTTTSLGTVTANTDSGLVTSSETLTTDSNQLAYATGGVIAGGKTGEGSENYSETIGLNCTLKDAACPDYDYDGVPDILDTDNDNNTFADEIDNQVDLCVPGDLKLYIENYPTCTNDTCAQMNFPTQDEVDEHIASDTMYTIHLEFTTGAGYSMSDIEEISVTTPSYVDSFGYVYDIMETDECWQELWTECNGKELRVMSEAPTKYQIAIADSDPANLKQGRLLSAMFPGDTFVANIKLTSGTTHVCTKKIGIIPKYFPYGLKYEGTAVDTDSTSTWATPINVSWTIPSRGPIGMTYAVYVAPYTDCTTLNASAYTSVFSGQSATSATMLVESLPTSAVNKWSLQLWAIDDIGDNSYTNGANFKTAASVCP